MLLAESVRFLWVHFQIIELCEAVSDEGIRDILENLPEGLYDTYTRIFKKIAITRSKSIVLKIMMWIVCAKRLLRIEELQEAVAFDSHDKSWNANKIPDSDKMIKSCHGLVIRDTENETVRLAHHTVQQYLLTPQDKLPATASQGFGQVTEKSHHWPELYQFNSDPTVADVMAGELCATYLCFSDFGTAISRVQDDEKLNLSAAFRDHGPVTIPTALGLGKHLHSLPYRFFGAHSNFKMPDIDYSKYLNVKPRDRRPSADFRTKFALLEYVIEHWPDHIKYLEICSEPELSNRFWDLVQHQSLAFEFRPWGPNRHFGPNGCKGCPVPDSDDLEPKSLPSMGLLHWAAETGALKAFDAVKPPLHEYLRHERFHDETFLIAFRHGQFAVVKYLLAHRSFNLSDCRAMIAACASGNGMLLGRLFQEQEDILKLQKRSDSSSISEFERLSPTLLYQAARDGHESIVKWLLARKVKAYVRDMATGLTPLLVAANNGHLEVVRALCILPRKKDIRHDDTGMTALHYAAVSGHQEIVTLLLNHGWDYDNQDWRGSTALIKASEHGQAPAAKILLDRGADPFIRGGENYHLVLGKCTRVTEYRERGLASPGPIAIHHAAANGHANVLDMLPYSDMTCGDESVNALHLGAAYGSPDVVQNLLSKGAKVDNRDNKGMSALHHASCNGHDAVIQLLLDGSSYIEGSSNPGFTALHFAAWAAKSKTVKLLVSHGAATDAKTQGYRGEIIVESYTASTPFHLAARYADADTIRALVDCGAPKLENRNNFGYTALDEALCYDKAENMLALIELGATWITSDIIYSLAFMKNQPKMSDILLDKLSTATAKEQQDAAQIIRGISASRESTHSPILLMLEDWEREWRVFGRSK